MQYKSISQYDTRFSKKAGYFSCTLTLGDGEEINEFIIKRLQDDVSDPIIDEFIIVIPDGYLSSHVLEETYQIISKIKTKPIKVLVESDLTSYDLTPVVGKINKIASLIRI
mgnify:CR=1 FL=1